MTVCRLDSGHMPACTQLKPKTVWVGGPMRPGLLLGPRCSPLPAPGCSVGVTATPLGYVGMLLSAGAVPCSRYLSGAAGELQGAVDVLPGLVVAPHEPEEEAGVVHGPCAGCLADFLQAALQLLNGFSVCKSKRRKGASQREEGCPVLQEALRALGPGNCSSCPRQYLGLQSELSLVSPVPSSLQSRQTKMNPVPQAHNPS